MSNVCDFQNKTFKTQKPKEKDREIIFMNRMKILPEFTYKYNTN